MTYPFPKETLEYSQKFIQTLDHISPLDQLQTMVYYTKENYDFSGSLRSGEYSYYPHEIDHTLITGFNCTTVIPHLYSVAHLLGFAPQIVQFGGIKDVHSHRFDESVRSESPHFALIVDVGRSRPYLVDTFFHSFGPIMERNDGSMHIGPTKYFPGSTREYSHLTYINPETFNEMILEGKDPGKSLDILIHGQSVGMVEDIWGHKQVQQMVKYTPGLHVETRITQGNSFFMSDCATARYFEDDLIDNPEKEGCAIIPPIVHLYKIRDASWDSIDGVLVGVDDLVNLGALWRKFSDLDPIPKSKIVEKIKDPRIGRKLLRTKNKKLQNEILNYLEDSLPRIGKMRGINLSPIGIPENIERLICLRTVYSYLNQNRVLVYTQQDHKKLLSDRLTAFAERESQMKLDELTLFLHIQKIQLESNRTISKLRTKQFQHDIKWARHNEATEKLRKMHTNNKMQFHYYADQLKFAQEYTQLSTDELRGLVVEKSLNPLIGYATLMDELVEFAVYNEPNLTMRDFREPIRKKLCAKYNVYYERDVKKMRNTAAAILDSVLKSMLNLEDEEKGELYGNLVEAMSTLTAGQTRTITTYAGDVEVNDNSVQEIIRNLLMSTIK